MHLDSAKSLIIKAKNITEDADTIKLNGGTGVITCEHAQASVLAQAIANAVVDEITANAEANVVGGSSAGKHKIA